MAPPAKKKKKHSSADPRPISIVGENHQQPMGSFWTPNGGRHKMNKPLKTIFICNDVWWNILPHFDHVQLGLKLAMLSPRFNCLVDKYFESKKELTLWKRIAIVKDRQTEEAKLSVAKKRKFVHQLPESPLPVKIRFGDLEIRYIDHSVITFLHTNKQIFDKGTKLKMDVPNVKKFWDVVKRGILPIFAENIRHLVLYDDNDHLFNYYHFISPTFLPALKRLNTIDCGVLFPDAIAHDGSSTTSQELANWLHTPTIGGQAKRLNCELNYVYYGSEANRWINNFKEQFLSAAASVCYTIKIEFSLGGDTTPIEPFELVNERTREKLTLTKEENDDNEEEDGNVDHFRLLMRCPIGKTIQREDETLDNLNSVYIGLLYNDSIGPLSSPTAAGPSKEKVV